MEKHSQEESQERESQKRDDAGARKGKKVAQHCVFPMFCGSEGSKSRLATAVGAEPTGQMRDEQLHAIVARSTLRNKKCQKLPGSHHFCKLRCLNVHAVVARNRFPSQNVQNTSGPDRF